MDGVMDIQLRVAVIDMSARSRSQVSVGFASGLHTEMPSITETTSAEHMEPRPEMDTTSDEISRTTRPSHLIEMSSV